MKYLGLPKYDDSSILCAISSREEFNSYPLLGQKLTAIESEYQHYKKVCGNAFLLNPPLNLDDALKNGLREDYGRKVKELNFITEIRHEISPDICPLCGSFSTGQVDHVVPKKTYPEFSLFSHNLVPACACNQTKSANYLGPNGERFLHPYYDLELKERISYIVFSGDVESPDLDVELVFKYRTNSNVKFHIESIVKRTNIFNWANKEWSKIQSRPIRSIFQRNNVPLTELDIKNMLDKAVVAFDEEFESPNNWKSMFYYGLVLKVDFHERIRDYVNSAYP